MSKDSLSASNLFFVSSVSAADGEALNDTKLIVRLSFCLNNNNNKSISHNKIDNENKIFRLFAGKVFESEDSYAKAIDNNDINGIVEVIQQPDEADIASYIKLIDKSPLENFAKLQTTKKLMKLDPTTNGLVDLEKTETNKLRDFMVETNTLAYDLFAINNGTHCNHFVGFKIIKNGQIWGVITIDALQPNGSSFYNYIGVAQGANTDNDIWLKTILLSFSKILSNFVERRNE